MRNPYIVLYWLIGLTVYTQAILWLLNELKQGLQTIYAKLDTYLYKRAKTAQKGYKFYLTSVAKYDSIMVLKEDLCVKKLMNLLDGRVK